jgi:hypothetical protein
MLWFFNWVGHKIGHNFFAVILALPRPTVEITPEQFQSLSPLRDPQPAALKLVVHLFFGEFFGRETADAFNRLRIILERQQPERPGAVFVAAYSTSAETVPLVICIVSMLSMWGCPKHRERELERAAVSCDSLSTRPRDNT